jgi:hypothetical protein
MKRSEINQLLRAAEACFRAHHFGLPPRPRWDVTDFGLGDWRRHGLVLVNLTAEPEYCEKVIYAKKGMTCPCHCHHRKKEDIICRHGELAARLWAGLPAETNGGRFAIKVNGEARELVGGEPLVLRSGERVTIPPRVYHEFVPLSDECIIGEVSTANDDAHDNFFVDPRIGRFPKVEEDEAIYARLVSDA